jgi:hypothetical protein
MLLVLAAGVAFCATPLQARLFPGAAPGGLELAQVQSQPLPPPAGAPQAPAPAATPPATPSVSTTEPPRTPTPMTKPAPGSPPPGARTTCPDEKVDINSASLALLRKLPQIGTQRSNSIVKARPYATPEDLLRKKVLKKAVFEKIKPCINASGVLPAATTARKSGTPASKSTTTPATKSSAAPAPAKPVPVPMPANEAAPKPSQ